METYNGHVRTPTDAIILFEACRIGLLPRVQRRLSEKERQSIKSGSVFVWDEREAGMRRWTDGKSWSASRVSGSFLTYREMEGKRGGSTVEKNANRDGVQGNEADSDGGPDGYRYKPDGLMKQSFSITTNNGQHLHLISYFSRNNGTAPNLLQPSGDPQLRHIRPEKGMYPESTVHEQSSIPAVTRGPMNSPGGYTHAPNQATYGRPSPYGYGAPPVYPPSPMHTPPPNQAYSPYYQHQPHGPYPGQSPLQNMHYPPPPGYGHPAQMTAFDRPPPPLSNNGLPPHSHQYAPPMGYGQPAYPNGHPYPPYNTPYYPPPLQAPSYPPPPQQPTYENKAPQPSSPVEGTANPPAPATAPSNEPESPKAETQAQAGAQPSASAGQTIPSISAMLSAGENGQPPPRKNSRSPTSAAPHPLQDIPVHKLGFEVNRDVQALRNLDKSTFK